ncbi:hypothetical protein J1614_002336 [Plenodomus biglobosus]|nr:hypothetical protein J1614_002336 [Plenodomus biglobosus]
MAFCNLKTAILRTDSSSAPRRATSSETFTLSMAAAEVPQEGARVWVHSIHPASARGNDREEKTQQHRRLSLHQNLQKTVANKTCSICVHQHRMHPSGRQAARLQLHSSLPFETNGALSHAVHPITQQHIATDRRPVKQLKRTNPKAALVKSTSHLMDIDMDPQHSAAQPHPVSDLRPCHACRSAPKRKRELENYLDCKRCDERTCYICARQCVGGCGQAICNKCTVEVGDEGDSCCLDCYARNLNS